MDEYRQSNSSKETVHKNKLILEEDDPLKKLFARTISYADTTRKLASVKEKDSPVYMLFTVCVGGSVFTIFA